MGIDLIDLGTQALFYLGPTKSAVNQLWDDFSNLGKRESERLSAAYELNVPNGLRTV